MPLPDLPAKQRKIFAILPHLIAFVATGTIQPAAAEPPLVAVASNFTEAFRALAEFHEQSTGHAVTPVSGVSGKHYAQIKNGAPFAAFFAADNLRPKQLEADGLAIPDSRFTYALGRLVLWSPAANMVDQAGRILQQDTFHRIALANPELAPYGKAAQQVLVHLGLWEKLKGKMVLGESIAQAFQFVQTGNAQLGFVAWSQVQRPTGSWWQIPPGFHEPIDQQAVLLKNDPVATEFMKFVQSPQGRTIIQAHGYALPDIQ